MENKKIAFLDRDGVINKKAEDHCYITRPEDFVFNESIFEVVFAVQNAGYEIIIITNQRGIARGLFTERQLHEIHAHMLEEFQVSKIEILDIFYCPHEIDTCDCRKPRDGMLRNACSKYQIDLPHSILISDSKVDVAMGETFGIGRNILVPADEPLEAMQLLTS